MQQNKAQKVIEEVKKAFIGKTECVEKLMTAILAGGHVLVEDVPGVGKTTLALAFAKAMNVAQNRVQFTPDVLPADITGFTVYNREKDGFFYRPGAAMCNILLADEINRTSPKTQAALLEVMEEGSVTVDGVTRPVPSPFLVIATQNPVGSARNPAAAPIPAGPVPDLLWDRISRCRRGNGYFKKPPERKRAGRCTSRHQQSGADGNEKRSRRSVCTRSGI